MSITGSGFWILCSTFAVAVSVILFISLEKCQDVPGSVRLVIGVISARDHRSQRQIIRETWGSLVAASPHDQLVFVVGEQDCHIHPQDRVSPNTCQKWNVNQDLHTNKALTFFTSHRVSYHSSLGNLDELSCFTGFGFRILHPVVLRTFSVRSDLIEHAVGGSVVFWDPEEEVERILVTENYSERNGYCNFHLESPLLLPAGFEGELRIVKPVENDTLCIGDNFDFGHKQKWVCEWMNHSLIEYKFLRSNENYVIRWSGNYCPLVSAEFTVSDVVSLNEHVKAEHVRSREWQLIRENVERKINQEQDRFGDILKFPGIDVYAHLPKKVMAFLNWVSTAYDATYILKTDDDTFINIEVLVRLMEDGGGASEGLTWWSVFHHHRAVPLWGKWSDVDYPALSYPAFPAGAGYLMTGLLAKRVGEGAGQVPVYGGEDVSVSVWVSALAGDVKRINVPCWLPHQGCSHHIITPQLSLSEIKDLWHQHLQPA